MKNSTNTISALVMTLVFVVTAAVTGEQETLGGLREGNKRPEYMTCTSALQAAEAAKRSEDILDSRIKVIRDAGLEEILMLLADEKLGDYRESGFIPLYLGAAGVTDYAVSLADRLEAEAELKAAAELRAEAQEEETSARPGKEEEIDKRLKARTPSKDVPDKLTFKYNPDMCLKLSAEEIGILERIVEAEAGDQDIYGMMLVANVIINRVHDPEFPNTVKGVVFQKKQFSPIRNGRYYRVKVSDKAKKAVDRVLQGEDYSRGAEFFFMRSGTTKEKAAWFDDSLKFLFKYGCHEFFK